MEQKSSSFLGKNPLKFPPDQSVGSDIRDLDVWKAFKEGDESAFIKIYKLHTQSLFNYGCQFTGDRELIKDCLQDFFIDLRRRREHLSDTDNIRFYLMKGFRRRLVHDYEKQLKEKVKSGDLIGTMFEVELSHELKLIESQMEAQQLIRLNKALEKLPSREREAIFYFYYENLSYQQIAELLQMDHVSSARRIIYRALAKMREIIIGLFIFILF
ncbi:MAG: sigma-70 family RNA polymerase sigma factor [Cyclobacteriaceae bacterium]|nr:sigma-70 family RNA polymerase sigma factor [Cyclobacteriaceae bacterium]